MNQWQSKHLERIETEREKKNEELDQKVHLLIFYSNEVDRRAQREKKTSNNALISRLISIFSFCWLFVKEKSIVQRIFPVGQSGMNLFSPLKNIEKNWSLYCSNILENENETIRRCFEIFPMIFSFCFFNWSLIRRWNNRWEHQFENDDLIESNEWSASTNHQIQQSDERTFTWKICLVRC